MTVRVTASGPSLGLRLSEFSDRRFKYLVIAPAILIILLIGLFPLIYTLMVSVQNISMTEEDTSFHGIVQYLALFRDSRLWLALLHTLIIAAVALPAELILGMLMALLFLERLPGRQIFVALLVLPIMIAPVVAGATWRLLFDNRYGPINQILGWFAGEPVTILWTINTHFVYPAILIAEIWQWTPFMFLLQLAAFMNIDQSLTESAQIDGASYWMIFRRIMLPAIWPVVAIAVLIRGLDLFRLFDVVWALTEGGPGTMTETISIYTYDRGFRQFDTSYTGAIAFLVIVLLSLVIVAALRRMEIDR
ncbi:MAG: sugar ABC transporter permease [Xanthobacteraceae bacterium]